MSELNETLKLKGTVTLKMYDADGKLIHEQCNPNLIVTVGKSYLATWLAAASQAGKFMSYIALGTGSASPTVGDTSLQSEFSGGGYSRQQGTLTGSSNVWQNVATFPAGNGTGAITEAGLFSAVTSGTMFARQVFAVVNKASGNTVIITWQVSFS